MTAISGATRVAHDRAEASVRETELGAERSCRVCGEWWPLDDEFFYRQVCGFRGFQGVCKACQSELRVQKMQRAAA